MIYRKVKALLASQFNILPENLTEEAYLVEDLGLDLVDLAIALEETFELEPLEDLSNMETLEDLVDFLQGCLDL